MPRAAPSPEPSPALDSLFDHVAAHATSSIVSDPRAARDIRGARGVLLDGAGWNNAAQRGHERDIGRSARLRRRVGRHDTEHGGRWNPLGIRWQRWVVGPWWLDQGGHRFRRSAFDDGWIRGPSTAHRWRYLRWGRPIGRRFGHRRQRRGRAWDRRSGHGRKQRLVAFAGLHRDLRRTSQGGVSRCQLPSRLCRRRRKSSRQQLLRTSILRDGPM
jgi:hypothetical protein